MPRASVVLGVRVSRVFEESVEVGPRVVVEFDENPDVFVDDGQSAERCCECPVIDEREETDGAPCIGVGKGAVAAFLLHPPLERPSSVGVGGHDAAPTSSRAFPLSAHPFFSLPPITRSNSPCLCVVGVCTLFSFQRTPNSPLMNGTLWIWCIRMRARK